MNRSKFVYIATLMTSYNFEFEELPDNLKCAQCKSVLKDAYNLSCVCTFCRSCIDAMMASGSQFCPGMSEDCAETLLSSAVTHHSANKSISKLTVNCPHNGCEHKCQLADIEYHLQECPKQDLECPFRQLGCKQNKLAALEMDGHLERENRRHSEILIGMVAKMNREIDANRREIEMLKLQLELKDAQIRATTNQIEPDKKSTQREKEDLEFQLKIFKERVERELAEMRENEELSSARLVGHVDTEILAVTKLVNSNKHETVAEINSLRLNFNSVKGDIGKSKVQPMSLNGQAQAAAYHEWPIDGGISKTCLILRKSDYFVGAMHPYKYRLASVNDGWTAGDFLSVWLVVQSGPNDGQLGWPFKARVVITVTDRSNRKACRKITLHCRIEKPPHGHYSCSNSFVFPYSTLTDAGVNLSRGLLVVCEIFLA